MISLIRDSKRKNKDTNERISKTDSQTQQTKRNNNTWIPKEREESREWINQEFQVNI